MNAPQNALQAVQKLEKRGFFDENNKRSEKTETVVVRTKSNGEASSVQTLEACFGGFRWLSLARSRKKNPTEQRRFLCECYKRRSKECSFEMPGEHTARTEKCCSHLKAGSYDGHGNHSTGQEMEVTKGAAGDLKAASFRLANAPTEPCNELVLNSNVNVASCSVQPYEGRATRQPNKSKYRTTKSVNRK